MVKQRLKESVMIRFMVCFVSLLVVKTGLLARQTGQTEKDILRYEVQVRAQVVPIFAVDSKGNAVYDLKEEETPKKKIMIKKINVNIIKELQDRKLDIFVLNVDPVTLKADIDMFQRKAGEKETIEVEAQSGKKQYIVIVEPEKTHCIFTLVS